MYPYEIKPVKNAAGCNAFSISKWDMLDRFLMLGTEGGTYYVGRQELTKENAKNVMECLEEDGHRVVRRIQVLDGDKRLPRLSPALFVLAQAAAHPLCSVRTLAFSAAHQLCRYGTALFEFVAYMQQARGWGRMAKRFVQEWYALRDPDSLAYQVLKYKQRNGWSHRDLLRLAKPVPDESSAHDAIYGWVTGNEYDKSLVPERIAIHELVHSAYGRWSDVERAIISHGFSWEMLPTEALTRHETWELLIPRMPMQALLRNVGRISALGDAALNSLVVQRLTNARSVERSRVHPTHFMLAWGRYKEGEGDRGKKTWKVDHDVLFALEGGFLTSLRSIAAIPAHITVMIDVSGSMRHSEATTGLTLHEAAAAMSLPLLAAAERGRLMLVDTEVRYSGSKAAAPSTLRELVHLTSHYGGGGTALTEGLNSIAEPTDAVVVYTDSESWRDRMTEREALADLRKRSGRDVKLVVVAMTPTGYSFANSADPNVLNVVGLDTLVPTIVENFVGVSAQGGAEDE